VTTMDILKSYRVKGIEIKKRLAEFSGMLKETDERVFAELCFCLCTPQSGAKRCWAAVSGLYESGALLNSTAAHIAAVLRTHGVRFCGTKAGRIVEARKHLPIKDKIDSARPEEARGWLVGNINGLGLKEASHFLRNIGIGQGFAILDRHILKNLTALGVISEVPKSMTGKKYLEIECLMKEFAASQKIPMDELDLLLWSMETGEVFK